MNPDTQHTNTAGLISPYCIIRASRWGGMSQPPTALNALARKGSSDEARTGHDYEATLNAHISQRFHDHLMIAKTLGGYCQGYDPRVSQGID
jgi:hypothetical protein